MPPKPLSASKPSGISKDSTDAQTVRVDKDAMAMPPPPVPAPQLGILEPEMNALSACLKNATVKTGQILQFYADTHRLHIEKHASAPPRSLQAALGRELEKYDQLCDSIEAHLLRAISVLQRDLQREKQRIQNAEREAAVAAAAAAAAAAEAEPISSSPASSLKSLPAGSMDSIGVNAAPSSDAGPSQSPVQGAPLSGRRPSAISISSLNRPSFPLKLDLSASSLRLSAEEAFLSSGLHSPVTLAPKSARPTDYDIMAAFASSASDSAPRVDIDLTLSEGNPTESMNIDLDSSLGNSADKPIELDMEGMDIDRAMSDLFGDSTETASNDANAVVDDLFSPVVDNSGNPAAHDIFASLGAGPDDISTSRPVNLTVPSGEHENAPSPGSLLASFASQPPLNAEEGSSSENAPTLTAGEPSFDLGGLDLEFFTADNTSDMNLDDSLWTMDGPQADGSGSGGDGTGMVSGDKPKP